MEPWILDVGASMLEEEGKNSNQNYGMKTRHQNKGEVSEGKPSNTGCLSISLEF